MGKKICKSLLIFACAMFLCADRVYAGDIVVDTAGERLTINTDTNIAHGITVDVYDINVTQSVSITNNGKIMGNINIADSHRVRIRNRGVINANFNFGQNTELIQVVSSADDLNVLGLASGYVVYVDSDKRIALTDVMNVAVGADKVILDGANLSLGGALNNDIDLELRGDVIVHLSSLENIQNVALMRNLTGDGAVLFDATDVPDLFALRSVVINGDVYAHLVRETDYGKILNNKSGEFLNDLRAIYPNNKLFDALDNAGDLDSLEGIMARSVHLNPVKLMRPVRALNMFAITDGVPGGRGVALSPMRIVSDDFDIVGVGLRGDLAVFDDVGIGASTYVGLLDASDDINEFSAILYGGNVAMRYTYDLWRVAAMGGVTLAAFDVGPVFNGDGIENNPRGISVYADVNIGRRFDLWDSVTVVPMLGIMADWVVVANDTDAKTNPYVGADIMIDATTSDVEYNYGVHLRGDISGNLTTKISMNVWSPYDAAGADIGIGVVCDDVGPSLMLRIGGRIGF